MSKPKIININYFKPVTMGGREEAQRRIQHFMEPWRILKGPDMTHGWENFASWEAAMERLELKGA